MEKKTEESKVIKRFVEDAVVKVAAVSILLCVVGVINYFIGYEVGYHAALKAIAEKRVVIKELLDSRSYVTIPTPTKKGD